MQTQTTTETSPIEAIAYIPGSEQLVVTFKPALQPLSSVPIQAVAYLPETQLLLAIFRLTGAAYAYQDFPASRFDELKAADSAGQFFNANIRGKYDYRKLGED